MFRKFIAMFVLMFFVMSPSVLAADEINWEKGIIRVTGIGKGPKNSDKNDSFYRTYARQAARLDALRNLDETVQRIQIDKTTKIPEELLIPDKIVICGHTKLKNARQVGETVFYDDGTCEVTMELPLFVKGKG